MAKLLLVEDDNNLREIYEARLQAEGYTIVSAKDGEEALVVAKAEKPDLVISDVMMPKISGFEMLDIMRNTNELKGVKVIMLTALGQSDDQERADKLGADRYLVKSQVTLEDIVKVTHELLDGDSAAPAPAGTTEAATPETEATPAPAPAAEPATAPEPAAPAEEEKLAEEPAEAASKEEAEPASKEKADVDAKIEDFVAGASSEPTAPANADKDEPKTPEASSDDKLMADAVNKLVSSTDDAKDGDAKPAGGDAPTAPAAPTGGSTVIPVSVTSDDDKPKDETSDGEVSGKKIIKPLDNAEPKKDINQLLAEEEGKQAMAAPGTTIVADASKDDAEDRPAGAPPSQPGAKDGVDPNSIAL